MPLTSTTEIYSTVSTGTSDTAMDVIVLDATTGSTAPQHAVYSATVFAGVAPVVWIFR
jgi:hypothetical protein